MLRLACYALVSFIAFTVPCANTHALPPMGLTQVTAANVHANLEIIDGSAYLNVSNGVWVLGPLGAGSFMPIANATSVTRVVKAFDGELYVAANRGSLGPALYQLDQLSSPVMTWQYGDVVGIDSQLRVIANLGDFEAAELFPGGCVNDVCGEFLPGLSAHAIDVTSNGYTLGEGGIPGTAGSSPMLWSPQGELQGFVFGNSGAASIRDRADGLGVNVGGAIDSLLELGPNEFFQFPNYVILDFVDYFLNRPDGSDLYESYPFVLVSQGNFSVAQTTFGPQELYGFFPGIVPGFTSRTLPLLDIFPQLSSIDIDWISDLASIDGRVYMTVRGSDGTFLFGARDPSIIVPEPQSLALFIAVLFAGLLASRPTERERLCSES